MVQGEERNDGWSDIEQELLEEILRKLTLVDYLKCRRVCRSWRHIVDEAVATKGTICPPAPQFPFLMLLPPDHEIHNPSTLLDITQEEDTSYTIPPPRTWKGYVDGVFPVEGGWMVFRKVYDHTNQNYDLVMFSNTVSGQEFVLPHFPRVSRQDFTEVCIELVFSSAPNSSDFFVVACTTMFPYGWQELAFCKVADKSWTPLPTNECLPTFFIRFLILDWKLYAVALGGASVSVYNLRDSNIITYERLVMLNPNAIPKEIHFEVRDGVRYCINESDVGMARDGDELLLVFLLTEHVKGNTKCRLTKGFRIFKLDVCGPRWIEVDDLGDRVLLIDDFRIQVMSAKKIKLPGKLSGGNCVFFSIKNRNTIKPDLGVFSLKDKSLKPLTLHSSLQDSLHGLWFMPSPW